MRTVISKVMFACWLTASIVTTPLMAADTKTANKATHTWAEVAKWPNFEGGIWVQERGPRNAGAAPQYQPEAAKRVAAMGTINPASLGSATCEPISGPFERTGEFFYNKDSIFIMMDEDYLSVRHIYMDGRDHGDPDLSYYGHSVGHWEGDTLVVDTVAFLPEVTITPHLPGEGATHSIERFRLTAPDTLEQQVTIINPKLLTAPWTFTNKFKLRRDLHVQEAECSQNNRNAEVDGKDIVDLTPPK